MRFAGKIALRKTVLYVVVLIVASSLVRASVPSVLAWSNGGFSSDPLHPVYGTHDWIAQHALDWLPQAEKQFIVDNLALYLYGTELPDNSYAPHGIGDTTKHHVYYFADGSLQDDASAVRAQQEYDRAAASFAAGDLADAARRLGIMSHYISDLGVFGHVMGSGTSWDGEVHHSDNEEYVYSRTDSYDAEFNVYLVFDGVLENVSAYNASLGSAYDTTFDKNAGLTCVWMDQNYDWGNPIFKDRAGESLNLAVNLIADVLHTFYLTHVIPEFPPAMFGVLLVAMTAFVTMIVLVVKRITTVHLRKQRL
jgi:hypothetical protein